MQHHEAERLAAKIKDNLTSWPIPPDAYSTTKYAATHLRDDTIDTVIGALEAFRKLRDREDHMTLHACGLLADRWSAALDVVARQFLRFTIDCSGGATQKGLVGTMRCMSLSKDLHKFRTLFYAQTLYWYWRDVGATHGRVSFEPHQDPDKFEELQSQTLLYQSKSSVGRFSVWVVTDPYRVAFGQPAFMVVTSKGYGPEHTPIACAHFAEFSHAKARKDLIMRELETSPELPGMGRRG